MLITSNYSKADWKTYIFYNVIATLPAIFFALAVIFMYIPFLEDWIDWMDYNASSESIQGFAQYVQDTSTDLHVGFITFEFLVLFGSAFFPILLISSFTKILGNFIGYVTKRIGIVPKMKLVIFKNGKPITRIRDLFK